MPHLSHGRGAGERYDLATALDAPPTRGLVTKVETLSDWNANGPVCLTTTKATYDAHGRTLSASDALNRTTRTDYTPATGGPVTSITTTNPKGHESTKTLNPAWGNATVEVDANGKRTDLEFDPPAASRRLSESMRPRLQRT